MHYGLVTYLLSIENNFFSFRKSGGAKPFQVQTYVYPKSEWTTTDLQNADEFRKFRNVQSDVYQNQVKNDLLFFPRER